MQGPSLRDGFATLDPESTHKGFRAYAEGRRPSPSTDNPDQAPELLAAAVSGVVSPVRRSHPVEVCLPAVKGRPSTRPGVIPGHPRRGEREITDFAG